LKRTPFLSQRSTLQVTGEATGNVREYLEKGVTLAMGSGGQKVRAFQFSVFRRQGKVGRPEQEGGKEGTEERKGKETRNEERSH
jgi:hypothetical protein